MVKKNSLKQTDTKKRTTVAPPRRSKSEHTRVSRLLIERIRQARYLLSLLGCLVVADGIISNFIVRNGLGREANPFIQSLVGQSSFIFMKLVSAIIGALLLWRVFKKHMRLGLASIILFVMIYTGILWWNLTVWFIGVHDIRF